MSDTDFLDFLKSFFTTAAVALTPGAAIYVCHADTYGLAFRTAFQELYHLSSVIIWVKNNFTIGRNDYHWKHEPILYGWYKAATHKWYGDRSQTSVWEISRESSCLIISILRKNPSNLVTRAVTNSSKAGDNVLDLFGGSGTTLVACEKLQRKCFMMELDEKFCDVIIARWEKLTDKAAILIKD
jgi:DNA modification methylase